VVPSFSAIGCLLMGAIKGNQHYYSDKNNYNV